MITLISTIVGFLSSLLPQALKVYQDKADKKHELDLMELQIKAMQLTHQNNIDEIAMQQETAQQATIYKTFYSGISWIDGFNALVRPIITFSFFGLYVYIKYMQYQFVAGADFHTIYNMLWGVEDQALFSSIIAFYFGNRTSSKLLSMRSGNGTI